MGKGRRDRTPVVKVTAQGSKRVSVAALITAKPGAKSPPDNAHRRLFTMPGISLPSVRTWAVLQEEAALRSCLDRAAREVPVITGPDEGLAAAHGRMRAAHADRERVVAVLKAAFVQGRLDGDELDARVGQAISARTYAELAVLTADLPGGTAVFRSARTPAQVMKKAACWSGVLLILAPAWLGIAVLIPSMPVSLAIFLAVMAVMAALGVFGYGIVDAVEARRSGRRLPSQPGRGGQGIEGGQGIKGGQGIEGGRGGREGPDPGPPGARAEPPGAKVRARQWPVLRAACAAVSAS